MKRLLILLCLLSTPALALLHHGSPGAPNGGQINFGGELLRPAYVMNALSVGVYGLEGAATPLSLNIDANGYPTGTTSGAINIGAYVPGSFASVPYSIIWTAGTKLRIRIDGSSGSTTGCAFVPSSGSGGSLPSGCSASILDIDGSAAGRLDMTTMFGVTPGDAPNFHISCPSGCGAANTAHLELRATSDVGRTGYITQNLVTELLNLRVKTIRTMGNNGSTGNMTKWAYRPGPNSLMWIFGYQHDAWSSSIIGTDQYTAAAAVDTPLGGWVQGEVLQGTIPNQSSAPLAVTGIANNGSGLCRVTTTAGTLSNGQKVWLDQGGPVACMGYFTVANKTGTTIDLTGSTFSGSFSGSPIISTTTLAVTGKSGGAKFIAWLNGNIQGNGGPVTAGIGTFVYDSILDRVLWDSGGISNGTPIEVQADLANQAHANLWISIPPMVDDNWVTSVTTAALSNLNSSLYLYVEYVNEVWNFGGWWTAWSDHRATTMGLSGFMSWYALRTREIFGNLMPSLIVGRNVRRVSMGQQLGDLSFMKTYRWGGFDLAPSGTSTGTGNAIYNSYTGSKDYTTFPNRPIDMVESIGYATYECPTNIATGNDCQIGAPDARSAAFLQGIATDFYNYNIAHGNYNSPTGITSIDNDMRFGTFSSTQETITCPSSSATITSAKDFTPYAGLSQYYTIIFNVTGGTICGGLTANIPYCIVAVTSNSFQVSPFLPSGNCTSFSSGITLTSGTGTVTAGIAWYTSMGPQKAYYEAFWEGAAASFDASRAGCSGPPCVSAPLRMENYEGGLEILEPTANQLAAVGVEVNGESTGVSAAAAIAGGIIAWKNSAAANATIQQYLNDFESFPHSKTPSWSILPGPGTYALDSNYLFDGSVPHYQLYNGFAAWSGGVP